MSTPILNDVKNRFLPIPESVQKCLEPEAKISDFQIKKKLEGGSFGQVFLVTHKKTKVNYAIKVIDKKNKTNIEEKPYFHREIEIMYKIHHPNVVKLFGNFEDDNYCYFIMEYISKGNIYHLIPRHSRKRLSTQIVASLMKDVISAVYFLHNMNPPIIHRDIKPENVLFGNGNIAKLTDFGWSNYMQGVEKRNTVCGTPIYLAPEIINESGYDEKVDIWCIGVLLFELSTGKVPFEGNDLQTLKRNINNVNINWPRDINLEAKNLISKILKFDPSSRISLREMLLHPYFTKYFPNAVDCLVKPNDNLSYVPFVVSKDDPEKYNPIPLDNKNIKGGNEDISKREKNIEINNKNFEKINQNENNNNSTNNTNINYNKYNRNQNNEERNKNNRFRDVSPLPNTKLRLNTDRKNVETNYIRIKYNILLNNYEKLQEQIDILKNKNPYQKEIEKLINELNEKDTKLKKLIKDNSHNYNYNNNEDSVLKLEKENKELKEKISKLENSICRNPRDSLNIKLSNIKDFSSEKNKVEEAIIKLKEKLNDDLKKSINDILSFKEREIEIYKENQERLKIKEKNKCKILITQYEQTLEKREKSGNEMKEKIKELEEKIKNANL